MRPEAFDAFAADYDHIFTGSAVGLLLRQRVWCVLEQLMKPGQCVLELACGTGVDAVWMAKKGVSVVATDGSSEMVALARAKAEMSGVSHLVAAAQMSFQTFLDGREPKFISGSSFDGLLSNFGGLNTIPEWRPLAERLATSIRPGGWLVLVVMGPFCPWEIGWYLIHGQKGMALRRKGQAIAKVGESMIPVWYPSASQLRKAFAPWFRVRRTESLGLLIPPSYLNHLVVRWSALFDRLAAFEAGIAHLTFGWGDHYLMLLERSQG